MWNCLFSYSWHFYPAILYNPGVLQKNSMKVWFKKKTHLNNRRQAAQSYAQTAHTDVAGQAQALLHPMKEVDGLPEVRWGDICKGKPQPVQWDLWDIRGFTSPFSSEDNTYTALDTVHAFLVQFYGGGGRNGPYNECTLLQAPYPSQTTLLQQMRMSR